MPPHNHKTDMHAFTVTITVHTTPPEVIHLHYTNAEDADARLDDTLAELGLLAPNGENFTISWPWIVDLDDDDELDDDNIRNSANAIH